MAIGLLVLLAIAPEIYLHSATDIQNHAPTIVWTLLNDFANWLNFNTSFTGKLIRIILNLISALYVNKMITDHKLIEKPGYLPAMNYLLLQMLLPELNSFHIICVNILLIITLKLMIIVYKNDKPINNLISAGFLSGSITMIWSEAVIYFVWLYISLLIMRPSSLREWIMILTGFILPFYLLSSLLYLTDELKFHHIFSIHTLNFILPSLIIFDWIRIGIILLIPLLFFVISTGQISKLLIQGRKTFIITLLLSFVTIFFLLFDLSYLSSQLGLIILPASILMSTLMLNSRKNLVLNLFILLLIVVSQVR